MLIYISHTYSVLTRDVSYFILITISNENRKIFSLMKHSFSIIVTRALSDNDPPAPLADWIININPGTRVLHAFWLKGGGGGGGGGHFEVKEGHPDFLQIS